VRVDRLEDIAGRTEGNLVLDRFAAKQDADA